MELYLLRHGKAEESHSSISSDAKRRLTESGRMDLEEIASGIVSLGIRPDVIISSPLVRAKETAVIVSKHFSKNKSVPKIAIWQDLKPESSIYQTHKNLISMAPDSHVLLVGHEPHMSSLTSSIIRYTAVHHGHADDSTRTDTNDTCDISMNLKKGGLVIIRANAKGPVLRGSLRGLMVPKQLKMCGRAKSK